MEYEIVVTRPSVMDETVLRVEMEPTIGAQECQRLGIFLQQQLKAKTNLRFELEFCKPGKLPRYTLKAKRFKDLRT